MKILIDLTGGTLACDSINGILVPTKNLTGIMDKYSNKYSSLSFDYINICSVLSETMDGEKINLIIKKVKKSAESGKYAGIILTHGSDTIQYTAAALSYALGLSSVPIVLVSSTLPLSSENSSGHDNLKAALDLIYQNCHHGVFVVNRESEGTILVHRASRLLPHLPYSSEINSVCNNIYGKFSKNNDDNAPFHFEKNKNFSENSDEINPFDNDLSKNCPILYIQPYPGMLYPKLAKDIKAVLLGSFHSGTINTESKPFASFMKKTKDKKIPVFVTGIGSGPEYATMSSYEELNIFRMEKCASPIAMLMKLWFVFCSDSDCTTVLKLQKSLGGDLNK